VPSTVADIFAATGATPAGVVAWGTPPLASGGTGPTTGLYVVALTDDPGTVSGAIATAPIDPAVVDELLAVRPEVRLDGARPTLEQLVGRLAGFWFPDEVVVYIGLAGPRKTPSAGGELAGRVGEYYKTRLGARSPHAGGWPLKVLSCLDDLYVHYGYCEDVVAAERLAIGHFAEHVSEKTRAVLHDAARVMPFANLEFPNGVRKAHGITGARAPKTTTKTQAPTIGAAIAVAKTMSLSHHPSSTPPSRTLPLHRSQNLTAKDIEVGQVRIPIGATKRILPLGRSDITVVLRGRELGTCRWDPRYGSDKERSGVIRVGKAAARELLAAGDVLAVSVDGRGAVSLD
jgi:hypothetical protein